MFRLFKALYDALKFKCDMFLYSFEEKTRYRINMIAQIIFGLLFIGVGIYCAGKWIYDMGSYPASLISQYRSYWYDKSTDSMLSISDHSFSFDSLNYDIHIEGNIEDNKLVFDENEIVYEINDEGECVFSINDIEYAAHYCNDEITDNVLPDFKARLKEKEENKE